MTTKNLKIDELDLDTDNPRITKAGNQREAMQKIIDDQGPKLANLAESIVEEGLNPMDRLLVMKSDHGKFVVLEGNRRAAAIKILKNPTVLTSLDVTPALQRRFEKLAEEFDPKEVEPIPCFEVSDRTEGNTWIEQRHSGEDEGRGIVSWSGVASSRFRGRDPALQALDFVRQHADLSEDEKKIIESGRFPISTLDRLLSTPSVRSKLGFEINDNKLMTQLPATEVIKPLRRMVLDLAEKRVNVTELKKKEQQVEYVSKFGAADKPNLTKRMGTAKAIESFSGKDFSSTGVKAKTKKRKPRAEKITVIPKNCELCVTNAKIAEIYEELRTLKLKQHPHAIAVLLRVLLETSVDHYLDKANIPLQISTSGGMVDKKLKKKVEESIEHMVATGANKKDFMGISRGINSTQHPFSVDLLHQYVHNRFVSPSERDLTTAWDNAQPLFERIWP